MAKFNSLPAGQLPRTSPLLEGISSSLLMLNQSQTGPQFNEHQVMGKPCFCLKTKELNSSRKFFVNFCSSPELKYPALDWDEEKFTKCYQEESKEIEDFRIPMALKPLAWTCDKRGDDKHYVIDVLVNDKYLETRITNSELFKTFLITISMDTIENKYNNYQPAAPGASQLKLDHKLNLDKMSWIVLKNKKYQEASGSVFGRSQPPTGKDTQKKAPIVSVIDSEHSVTTVADMRNDANRPQTKPLSHYKLTYCPGTNTLNGIVKCKQKHVISPDLESLSMRLNDDHIHITLDDSGASSPTSCVTLLDIYIPMLIDVESQQHKAHYDPLTDCLKFVLKLCDNY